MNNRIMAMLFALVAAMFISIVPVKAEAASYHFYHEDRTGDCVCDVPFCNQEVHSKTVWKNDQYLHRQVCAKCNKELNSGAHTDVTYKETWGKTMHTMSCKTCGYTETQEHNPVKGTGGCRCADCGILVNHTYELVQGDANHAMICKICGDSKDKAEHTWTVVDNGNGTHTKTCSGCEKVVANEACADVTTDKDCACDVCGAVAVNNCCNSRVEVAGKAATCEETGISGHLKCEFCGQLYSKSIAGKKLTEADVTTKALGHKAYSKWEKDEDGHYHMCQNTGCKEKLEYTEHTPGTYNHDAKQHWATCSVCGAGLEKVDHDWIYTHVNYTQTHKVKCSACKIGEFTEDCKDEDKDCYCDKCEGLMFHNKADMEYLCKTPTCTEDGWYENWQCKTCETHFDTNGNVVEAADKFRPATGHKFDATWDWHQTEDGSAHFKYCGNGCNTHVYGTAEDVQVGDELHTHERFNTSENAHEDVCAVCKQTYGYEKHEYTEVELAKASSTGTQRHKLICECGESVLKKCVFDENCICKVCGDEKVHTIDALSTVPGAKEATCTKDGVKTHYQCNTCKNIFKYEDGKCTKITAADTVIPALGHDWMARPNTLNGQHLQQCKRCSATQTLDCQDTNGDCLCDVNNCGTLVHSHKLVFVAAKEATCTEGGAEAYYKYQDCGKMFDLYQNPITAPKATPANGHDFGDWTPCEGGIHAKFCANCDEFQTEEHKFQNGNVQCSVCGGEEELTHVDAEAATCTENGNVEYWYSKITGKKYADAAGNTLIADVTVKATGHDMSGWEDAANGVGHKQVCMNVGCEYTLTANHNSVNSCFCTECGGFKTGHAMEMKNAVAATCAKEGTQAYFQCSCGKIFDMGYNQIEAPVAIKKLNHNYDNAKVQKDAKNGQHYVACADCGNRVYQDHAMQMSDPNKGNYHQYLCSCGELEIETHYDKNGDNKCDVCGHSMNGTQETTPVEQHDNKTVITGQADTVQSSNSWWQNWLEALTPSNSGGNTATEKAPETSTSTGSTTTTSGNTASSGNTTTGTANTGNSSSTGSTASSGSTTTAPSTSGSTTTAPSAEQTSVIAQFITWFLGLFGF